MSPSRARAAVAAFIVIAAPLALLPALALGLSGCDGETPTTVSVRNGYPAVADGGDPASQTVVYRVWYASTAFVDPIAGGDTSAEQRTVPGADYVYAVLAVGWDPASAVAPTNLIAVKSKERFSVKRGTLGLVAVSPAAFDGDCAAGSALAQADADFITDRIHPGPFTGFTYDAKTCKLTAVADGGAEGGAEGDARADAAADATLE